VLLSLAGATCIDLLKIDIERSEIEVFNSGASAWLDKVRNICIELHGPDCERAFLNALADFDYDVTASGELTICRNLRRRTAAAAAAGDAGANPPTTSETGS
jgi:hypothetical protein